MKRSLMIAVHTFCSKKNLLSPLILLLESKSFLKQVTKQSFVVVFSKRHSNQFPITENNEKKEHLQK